MSWSLLYLASEWSIRFIMLAYVPQRRSTAASRTWLLLIFLLPWPGLLLYAIFGRVYLPKRRIEIQKLASRRIREVQEQIVRRGLPAVNLPLRLASIVRLAQKLGDFDVMAGNSVELLPDYEESISRLVADIVSTWLERGHGRPTLCFAVNRAHAKSIRDKFEQEGVRCAYVDAFTPREERDDIGVAMAEGVTQVTVNIGCLTTGTDWPHVSCIILARPTKSESLFVQIMGRGLRPIYPDGFDEAAATDEERAAALATMKDHCLFLDHSDTHTRLGMITDIDHNHLSLARASRNAADGKERDEVVLPRACQCCGSLVPPRSSKCPSCGHTNVAPNQVDQIDGELVELRGAGQRPAKKGKTVTEQLKSLGPQELKAQINSLRREMNWSNGRASHFYKDIMGVWPKGDWDFSIPYAEPCGILRSFDRHRRIAYAKGMAAQKRA